MSTKLLQVLPVIFTKDTALYGGDPIFIGAHYPITEIQESGGYGYIDDQKICQGPLKLMPSFVKGSGIELKAECSVCGLKIEPSQAVFKSKRDWYGALNRWIISKVERTHYSDLSCPTASLSINRNLNPAAPLLDLPPVMLALLHSPEIHEHANEAYSMIIRRLLKITRNASSDVKREIGYK
ncbi:MAG: hypothetical protein ACNFW9_04830 [Candidatus Kerfeldbacteria bacterium]